MSDDINNLINEAEDNFFGQQMADVEKNLKDPALAIGMKAMAGIFKLQFDAWLKEGFTEVQTLAVLSQAYTATVQEMLFGGQKK